MEDVGIDRAPACHYQLQINGCCMTEGVLPVMVLTDSGKLGHVSFWSKPFLQCMHAVSPTA